MTKRVKEEKIEKALVAAIRIRNGEAFKLYNYPGIPDRLVLLPNGKALFVELKRPGEEPRRDQEAFHFRLRKLGFKVYVISSIDAIIAMLEEECTSK